MNEVLCTECFITIYCKWKWQRGITPAENVGQVSFVHTNLQMTTKQLLKFLTDKGIKKCSDQVLALKVTKGHNSFRHCCPEDSPSCLSTGDDWTTARVRDRFNRANQWEIAQTRLDERKFRQEAGWTDTKDKRSQGYGKYVLRAVFESMTSFLLHQLCYLSSWS